MLEDGGLPVFHELTGGCRGWVRMICQMVPLLACHSHTVSKMWEGLCSAMNAWKKTCNFCTIVKGKCVQVFTACILHSFTTQLTLLYILDTHSLRPAGSLSGPWFEMTCYDGICC